MFKLNKKRKAFLSVEMAIALISISIILLTSIGFYSLYIKSKINLMKNIQNVYDLYFDIQYHMKKIGYPDEINNNYIIFTDENNCNIKYFLNTENHSIEKDISGCDTPELNEQKILIKNIQDIDFEYKNNYILLLKIYTISNRDYPIIFSLHTPLYENN